MAASPTARNAAARQFTAAAARGADHRCGGLKADQFLLIAHGSPEEVQRAREILASTEPHSVVMHAPEPEETLVPA